ncbi:hypothetical protein C2845_PM07G02590 [Panicum miliaceum]|uniref:DNA mismatch repair protein MLH3 n=1 Tax=Panicum miliaceum TaxID=4540 RepID=A0A3L6SGZ1_PANMI|nr:hypothetical protein C2845_PM07G02590 [Panicum miliaceum]
MQRRRAGARWRSHAAVRRFGRPRQPSRPMTATDFPPSRTSSPQVPCISGVNLTGKDLIEFIQQLDENDGSSGMPPAVLRILNFKACRGAIMFGDPLLQSECCLIVEELKATSLCFQCAHGRPTMVPIVNVASLRGELARHQMLKAGGDLARLGAPRAQP